MTEKRFRFMTDDDGHVYLIPADMREKFLEMEEDVYLTVLDQGGVEKFIETFDQYRVGSSVSAYSFTDPQND